jgi:hypothetical protein
LGIGQWDRSEVIVDYLGGHCWSPRPAPTPSLIGQRQRFFGNRDGYLTFEAVE